MKSFINIISLKVYQNHQRIIFFYNLKDVRKYLRNDWVDHRTFGMFIDFYFFIFVHLNLLWKNSNFLKIKLNLLVKGIEKSMFT